MAKAPNPKILPPEPKEIATPSTVSSIPQRRIFLISSAFLLTLILWGFNEFTSLRGVIHVLASRIVLGGMWVAGILLVMALVSAVPIPPKSKRITLVVLSLVWTAVLVGLDQWAPKPSTVSLQSTPISFRLGCDWDHLPIHIAPASTIHVIRLYRGTLIPTNFRMNIQDEGSFENISSSADTPLDWPSERDGKWMTKAEFQNAMKSGSGMPNPWTFRCTMASYSTATLDEMLAFLLIDTPDKQRHSFKVPFDPIMSGHSFTFYMVNVCSSGTIPQLIQWSDTALVRVLGETTVRQVPLRYEKTSWPSQLFPGMGPSSFVWNGIGGCQWDQKP
jgi:hypothetical protein